MPKRKMKTRVVVGGQTKEVAQGGGERATVAAALKQRSELLHGRYGLMMVERYRQVPRRKTG